MSINPGLKKYMIVMSTFVCQVMKFDDLKELGSESAVKVCVPALNNCPCSSACVEFRPQKSNSCVLQAAGKYKQEGKTYVVQDGDIIFFKFNVSGGGKK